MFHLPKFRHFIRLLTLIVFTLGLASVNPFASVDAHVPPAPSAPAAFVVADAGETNSTATTAPSALTEAVQAAVTRFLGEQPTSSVIVEDIRYDAGWAAGSVLIMASEDRPAPTAWVFLARQEATRWSVALEPEAQFQTWLAEVPASVMSEEVQALFRIAPSLAGNGAAQLSLPWATGETWYFTGGPHVGGFGSKLWSAIDFAGGSGNIRAAREGVAYTYASCPNFIRVVHSDGWRTTYYHVAQSSISVSNGQTIQRGTYLGKTSAEVGCGGYATGPHVHFSLELNGQGVAFHGIDVGGWTVAGGGAEYQGTMTRIRDGAVRSASIYLTANNSIYNDGTIGSGTPPAMAIDNPGNGVSVNRDIVINGWAMHAAAATGTGVDAVHIYFDGPAGSGAHGVAATYGTRRDDLAAAYGERFRYAGFEFGINSAQLSLGQHTLYVYARSTVTGEWQLQTRTFTVVNIPPNMPTHATPANGATLVGPTVAFTWNDPGDPDNRPRDYRDYVLQVIDSAGTVVAEMPWAATTSWQTNLADGAYTWRLHAGDGAEGSGWSSNWSFTVRSRYTISGQVTAANGAGLADVTVSDGTRNATTNAEGAYTLNDVPPGTYTLTPTKEGYRFEPATRNVTVNGNVTGQDFAARLLTYTVSGQVTAANGAGLAGVTVSDGTRSATTNAEGAYTLNDVPPGTYTLTPTKEGYRFGPATRNVTVNGNVTGQDFAARANPATGVVMELKPAATTMPVSGTMNVAIEIRAGDYDVDAAAAYLTFDPEVLEITKVEAGTAFPVRLLEELNNTAGTLDLARGTMTAPWPQGTFTLATVTFRAKQVAPAGTELTLSQVAPRQSDVTFEGASLLENVRPATITVVEGAPFTVAVQLEGRPQPPHARLRVPLEVVLSVPTATTTLYRAQHTTDDRGQFQLAGVVSGTYTLRVKHPQSLRVARTLALSDTAQVIQLGALPTGDANNDNRINVLDFSLLAGTFGRMRGADGYDARADFNGDEMISVVDFSLLVSNFGQLGEPDLLTASSAGLTQAPLALVQVQRDVRAGEEFTLQVAVEAPSGGLDGIAAYLDFAPDVLEVVDLVVDPTLEMELQREVLPNAGQINLVRGTLNATPPTGVVPLATITFRARRDAQGTQITLVDDHALRQSLVTLRGQALTPDEAPWQLTLTGSGSRVYLPLIRR